MKMNEIENIRKILDGNADAYSELVERYHVGLIIYCEQIVKDRDVAEDIAQEAFIKAYEKLGAFDQSKRFSTWLYKIASNKCLDYLRQSRKIMRDVDPDTLSYEPATVDEMTKQQVRDAVSALTPPEYRRVIEAYYWEGRSYQEIADELGQPVNTIRTWIRRSKQKLQGELA